MFVIRSYPIVPQHGRNEYHQLTILDISLVTIVLLYYGINLFNCHMFVRTYTICFSMPNLIHST